MHTGPMRHIAAFFVSTEDKFNLTTLFKLKKHYAEQISPQPDSSIY